MTNRRKFLQQTGAMALGSLMLPRIARASTTTPASTAPASTAPASTTVASTAIASTAQRSIGIQLYTLSDLMSTDTKGTLQKVATIGYKELETAATPKGYYYGYKPKEFAAMAKDMGMHWRSQHVMGAPFNKERMKANIIKMSNGDTAKAHQLMDRFKFMETIPTLSSDYQRLADEAAEGGISYLICASIPVDTLDEIKTAVDVFSKAGEACKKAGVQFAYHNHTTEFDQVEGHRPFDYILSNTDKDLVKMELDLAWATRAGQDPAALFAEHPGRFPCWHVKDLDATTKLPAEVGTGIVDFKHIFEHAATAGMKYFFVEQDQAPQPLQNVTNSYNYLKKMLS